MNKIIIAAFAAATLASSTTAFAQFTDKDAVLSDAYDLKEVQVTPDQAKGEVKRLEYYDSNGTLIDIHIEYKNGHFRTESYNDQRQMEAVVEGDDKSYLRKSYYNNTGILKGEVIYDLAAGSRVVYVNIDFFPDLIKVNMNDSLYLFSSNGSSVLIAGADIADGGTTDVLKASTKQGNPPAGFKDRGGFTPARQGAASITLISRPAGRHANFDSLTVLVQDPLASSGAQGRVVKLASPGIIPSFPGQTGAPASPPPDPVAYAIIVARDASTGKEMARTISDNGGFYRLALPQGNYELIIEYPAGRMRSFITRPVAKQTLKIAQNQWFNNGDQVFESIRP